MPFPTEGTSDDPDAFLKEAIESKIADLARRIEKELGKGAESDGEEVARLTAARARFSEILRSPRIYLAGAPAERPADRSAAPAAAPAPAGGVRIVQAAAPAQAAPPAGLGQMRAFLETLRTGGAAPAGPKPAPAAEGREAGREAARPATAPAAERAPEERSVEIGTVRKDVLEAMKRRAASQGFKDVHELLRYKKEKVQASLKTLVSSRADVDLIQALRKDLKRIEALLEASQEEAARGVEEFDEVADVDKGNLAALRKEMAGLMKEIR